MTDQSEALAQAIEALKPCPFCGGSGSIASQHDADGFGVFLSVKCAGCGAQSPQQFATNPDSQTYQEVRETWNRRSLQSTAPAAQPVASEADAHLRALLRYTENFYGTAIEHGMKAGETANAIAHVEQAARALHRLASLYTYPAAQEQQVADPDLWKVEKLDDDRYRIEVPAMASATVSVMSHDAQEMLLASLAEEIYRSRGALSRSEGDGV